MDLQEESKEDDNDSKGDDAVQRSPTYDADYSFDQGSPTYDADQGSPTCEASEHFNEAQGKARNDEESDEPEDEDDVEEWEYRHKRVDEMRTRCQEHFDQLKTLAFTLARSSMLVLNICEDILDDAWMTKMEDNCEPEDVEELKASLNNFFTRKPVLQSTPPKQDSHKARVLKAPEEIQSAWQRIIEKRRILERNDRVAINVQEALAQLWTDWMH